MFKYIKKRNQGIVKFEPSKITSAIARAGKATNEFEEDQAEILTLHVLKLAEESFRDLVPEVEWIQDIVERVLFESRFFKTAKAYILYRDQHTKIRNIAAGAHADLIDTYLDKLDWKVRENSNMCYSLQGLNNYISSDVTSKYWLDRIYPPEIRDAHQEGDFHIHDLSLLSVYCVGWDLKDLLIEGFRGVDGKVESLPPKHFRSALGQLVNFFYTLQGEAAGAQAVSHFDTLLAPFVRFDNLGYSEVRQALQEFIFNTNVPTRVGFSTPFTNITLDLCPSPLLKDQRVIIGGCEQNETYGEFQPEITMINKAFADVMLAGDAKGRAFTFPIPTYAITNDFNWNDPDLQSIWKMAGKYGTPYFANFINADLSPDDTQSMCCRLRLDRRELIKRGGGLFAANPLTGSIGVVTINLPRIGYLSRHEDEFYERVRRLVVLAHESLSIKRKVLETFTDNNLYPYSKFFLRQIKQGTGSFWKHHFSTIGIIGMNEACRNFLGTDIGSTEGIKFSLKVMDFIRSIIADMQDTTGDLINLEATPGESTAYRFAMLDKQRFSDIICANEAAYQTGSAPFYTNSTHLPVNYTDDIFETLELQEELQAKYTGGTVLHIYLGEEIGSGTVVKDLIKKIVHHSRIPYFTLTPTFSICSSHGYLNGKQERCPFCDSETEIYSRVVGYLRPVKQWNTGKQAEFALRDTFTINNMIARDYPWKNISPPQS